MLNLSSPDKTRQSGPTEPKESDKVTHFYDEQIHFPCGMYIWRASTFFRNNKVIDFSYGTAPLL